MIANVNRSLIRLGKPAGSPGACSLVSVGPSNMLGLSYQVAQLKPIFLNIQSNDALIS